MILNVNFYVNSIKITSKSSFNIRNHVKKCRRRQTGGIGDTGRDNQTLNSAESALVGHYRMLAIFTTINFYSFSKL